MPLLPRGLAAALHRALPSQCAVCHAWPAQRICADCLARFAPAQPRCSTCALPVPAGVLRCGACVLHAPPLDRCHAAVDYAFPWAQILSAFKFHDDPGWAAALADLLRLRASASDCCTRADVLLPIPLSAQRLRQRGFNQAALLAHALAPAKVHAHTLLRLHETPAQSQLTRAQRLCNLQGALALEPSAVAALAGRRVLLVDDVMTTGATLQAAAEVLRQAGVAEIAALVVARTALQ